MQAPCESGAPGSNGSFERSLQGNRTSVRGTVPGPAEAFASPNYPALAELGALGPQVLESPWVASLLERLLSQPVLAADPILPVGSSKADAQIFRKRLREPPKGN